MTRHFLSLGECMVEMAATGDGVYRQNFAGDTFNTAWYARRALGPEWQVSYFTTVGDETLSSRMLAFMESENVSTHHIRNLPGRAPGLYLISLDHGERSFTYWRDTSAAKSLADDEETLSRAVEEADAIYFSGITLAILPPERRERFLAIMGKAKARGQLVAFDANIRHRLWPDKAELRAAIRVAAKVCTMALPGVPDESELFGEPDARILAQRYRDDGVTEIVVKAAADPALVIWPQGEAVVPAISGVTPVDTTGAGDSFTGAYLAARLSGEDPVASVKIAHATAARVIQAHGALVR